MKTISLVITNPAGLHARPAAQFVQKAASFKSNVKITANHKTVSAKSILEVMGMGLGQGTELMLMADGVDEVECIKTLKTLIESNFGER